MHGKTEFSEDELCDLLTTSESQQLGGGTTGTPTMNVVLEAPLCQWTDATSLNIVYSPKNGIKDLETGPTIKKSKIRIVGLDGVMSDNRKPGGLCQVGIDLTDHSSLVVGVGLLSAGEGKYDHCEVAKEMATIVFTKVK